MRHTDLAWRGTIGSENKHKEALVRTAVGTARLLPTARHEHRPQRRTPEPALRVENVDHKVPTRSSEGRDGPERSGRHAVIGPAAEPRTIGRRAVVGTVSPSRPIDSAHRFTRYTIRRVAASSAGRSISSPSAKPAGIHQQSSWVDSIGGNVWPASSEISSSPSRGKSTARGTA